MSSYQSIYQVNFKVIFR